MNKVLSDENELHLASGEEYCPYCDTYIGYAIDKDDFWHYEFTCPNCGHKLMLCDLCHQDYGDICDWNSKTGLCRLSASVLDQNDKVFLNEKTGFNFHSSWQK